MNKPKPLCITFAGVVGCSKTPTAHFLSWNLGLPIFSSDSIRIEMLEDEVSGSPAIQSYEECRSERLNKLIARGKSFIYDASVDRRWTELKEQLDNHNYSYFIISFNLSKKLLKKMLDAKGYHATLGRLDKLLNEHKAFWNKHKDEVDLVITDKEFPNRFQLALTAIRKRCDL